MKLIIGQVQSGHAVIYVGHIDGGGGQSLSWSSPAHIDCEWHGWMAVGHTWHGGSVLLFCTEQEASESAAKSML